MSSPAQPAEQAPELDAGEVVAELGRVHAELAAHGAVPLCAELAQRRVLERRRGEVRAAAATENAGNPLGEPR